MIKHFGSNNDEDIAFLTNNFVFENLSPGSVYTGMTASVEVWSVVPLTWLAMHTRGCVPESQFHCRRTTPEEKQSSADSPGGTKPI
jgi:hypothetical protein